MADTPQKELFTTIGGLPVYGKTRGKHYIEPRGYAAPPGTGPKGETCGSCKHIFRELRYRKCEARRGAWSHSRGTDILAGSPACRQWEKPAP